MKPDTVLTFSDAAEAGRSIFYHSHNDVTIFVEDKNREYEYEHILKKLFADDIHIEAIFSANGKPGVKDRFYQFGEKTGKKNNFYIVDGDFDRYVFPDDMIVNSHFIYLETYNIENYFIDEKSIIEYCQGKLRLGYEATKQRIDYVGWKERIVREAEKLFFLYCYVQKQRLSIENVSRSPYTFIDRDGYERQGKYDEYKALIEKDGAIDNAVLQEIKDMYQSIHGTDFFFLICGKFLLTSLYNHLYTKMRVSINQDDLRWFLITRINISNLMYLKDKMLSCQFDRER